MPPHGPLTKRPTQNLLQGKAFEGLESPEMCRHKSLDPTRWKCERSTRSSLPTSSNLERISETRNTFLCSQQNSLLKKGRLGSGSFQIFELWVSSFLWPQKMRTASRNSDNRLHRRGSYTATATPQSNRTRKPRKVQKELLYPDLFNNIQYSQSLGPIQVVVPAISRSMQLRPKLMTI